MAEQVQKQKALHLESDVRIEHDAQAVEDAGPWRLQVPVFEDEAVLDNAEVTRPDRSTSGSLCMRPTRRAPAISCP